TRFTHYYATGVTCCPARTGLMTGRFPATFQKYPSGFGFGNRVTITELLKQNGYATGHFGKWHIGTVMEPGTYGIDVIGGEEGGKRKQPTGDRGRDAPMYDQAVSFIEKHKDGPFFCYLPFTTPHSPWSAPPENWAHFRDKAITQTATEPDKEVADETRCALAMLENQDWNVGRVLAKLEELHLQENTIVLYFSDNGPNTFRWTGGMRGKKGMTDEGGVRSVCYLRWPGKLPAGRTVS
ncbi:MAG: sulfatase-like hydrolase/transferase, partial [Verrucomicrobiae bacterium]|nr:sulfatase-like hydrolase/transferase [Verrucomicrobiae bacterium]